jgi:hypothetical protein
MARALFPASLSSVRKQFGATTPPGIDSSQVLTNPYLPPNHPRRKSWDPLTARMPPPAAASHPAAAAVAPPVAKEDDEGEDLGYLMAVHASVDGGALSPLPFKVDPDEQKERIHAEKVELDDYSSSDDSKPILSLTKNRVKKAAKKKKKKAAAAADAAAATAAPEKPAPEKPASAAVLPKSMNLEGKKYNIHNRTARGGATYRCYNYRGGCKARFSYEDGNIFVKNSHHVEPECSVKNGLKAAADATVGVVHDATVEQQRFADAEAILHTTKIPADIATDCIAAMRERYGDAWTGLSHQQVKSRVTNTRHGRWI